MCQEYISLAAQNMDYYRKLKDKAKGKPDDPKLLNYRENFDWNGSLAQNLSYYATAGEK